ncbi:hypothetical protein ACS0ON_004204 [Cronobacter dublinensis]
MELNPDAKVRAINELISRKIIIKNKEDICFGSRVTQRTFDEIEVAIRALYPSNHDFVSEWKEISAVIKKTDMKSYERDLDYKVVRDDIIRNTVGLINKITSDYRKYRGELFGSANIDSLSKAINICERFGLVVDAMKIRYASRPPLLMNDEYDVQDLLHALLKIEFDDIRCEDAVSSTFNRNARVDFVLHKEKIVIECKMTRAGLNDKEIGKQLIEDILKYTKHPDCGHLICLVYDPAGLIVNEAGIQNDLNRYKNVLSTTFLRVK